MTLTLETPLRIKTMWANSGAQEAAFSARHSFYTYCKGWHTSSAQQPNGFRIDVIFSDKQHNYSLISISEWPLCLCEQTDGPIVGPDAWERSTPTTTHWGAKQSSHAIRLSHLMKLSFNLPGRGRDGGGGKKEASSLFSLLSVFQWICDLHTQRNKWMGKPELSMNQKNQENPGSQNIPWDFTKILTRWKPTKGHLNCVCEAKKTCHFLQQR